MREAALALLLFAAAAAVKLSLLQHYASTDFDVHRNWLAVTHNLPPHRWYKDTTNQWTLDYPPLFAYFEWLLARVAAWHGGGGGGGGSGGAAAAEMLRVSAADVRSPYALLFQRATVIASDVFLLLGVYAFTQCHYTSPNDRRKRMAAMTVTLLNPGLILVDHIHFQYNGFLIGLFLCAAALLRRGDDVAGAALFTALVLLKHIFLYVAPAVGVYLLARAFDTQRSWRAGAVRVAQLAAAAAAVAAAAFAPLVYSQWRYNSAVVSNEPAGAAAAVGAAAATQLRAVVARLFPFGDRGLVHAYWAPNAWALYNTIDKVLARAVAMFGGGGSGGAPRVAAFAGGLVGDEAHVVLPRVTPLHCVTMTLAALAPALARLWRSPQPRALLAATVFAQLSAFMFGWHVHEKAILVALVPLGLLIGDSPAYAKCFLLLSFAGTASLLPLIHPRDETRTKVALSAALLLLAARTAHWLHRRGGNADAATSTSPWPAPSPSPSPSPAPAPSPSPLRFTTAERAYVALLLLSAAYAEGVAHWAAASPAAPAALRAVSVARLPFLPLLVTSVVCAVGVAWFGWLRLSQLA